MKCGLYVHHGPCLCDECSKDLRADLVSAREVMLNVQAHCLGKQKLGRIINKVYRAVTHWLEEHPE